MVHDLTGVSTEVLEGGWRVLQHFAEQRPFAELINSQGEGSGGVP